MQVAGKEMIYEVLWSLICDCKSTKQLETIGKMVPQQDLPENLKEKLRVSYAAKARNLKVTECVF